MILKSLRTLRRVGSGLSSGSPFGYCNAVSRVSETCAACTALFDEYHRKERLADDALRELKVLNTAAGFVEYSALRVASDEARLDTDVARLELHKHLDTHRKAS